VVVDPNSEANAPPDAWDAAAAAAPMAALAAASAALMASFADSSAPLPFSPMSTSLLILAIYGRNDQLKAQNYATPRWVETEFYFLISPSTPKS
jgi:hypothetical protein